jgi:nucleotide-binding universal stress UspA family protein
VALRETGRPVLISSSAASDTFGKRIAIAWEGSAEAVRAVNLAMEFLQRAEEVVVISVNEHGTFEPSGDSLAEYLQWQGIRSRTVTVDGSAASAGMLLLEQIKERESDKLVMGAYTRDRIQRVIFGGVTGEVLAHKPVPILMVDSCRCPTNGTGLGNHCHGFTNMMAAPTIRNGEPSPQEALFERLSNG